MGYVESNDGGSGRVYQDFAPIAVEGVCGGKARWSAFYPDVEPPAY